MTGIALFAGASVVCGVSQFEGELVVARGFQGLGGAMVSPATLSIILTTFAEGQGRNRALSVWGAIAGAGGAAGLLLGGVLVQLLSWRWVFFVKCADRGCGWCWSRGSFRRAARNRPLSTDTTCRARSRSRSGRWRWCSR